MAHQVLAGYYLNGAVVYFDDTVIYGEKEKILGLLDKVLGSMAHFNVRLKPASSLLG